MRTYRKLKGIPLPCDNFADDEMDEVPELPEFELGGREYERMKKVEEARKEGREPSPEKYKFPRDETILDYLKDDEVSDIDFSGEEGEEEENPPHDDLDSD